MSAYTSAMRGPKEVKMKCRTVTRSMTSGTELAKFIKGTRLIGVFLQGTASNAGTSATLTFGNTSSADEYSTSNALAAGVGGGGYIPFDATAQTILSADGSVYVKYAETGTSSSAGDWLAFIMYTDGNFINNDTI